MEKLCDLYFELSNEERLGILHMLNEHPDTLTGLSERLGIRNQQCSRHLARLTERKLIRKTVDGGYELTGYGIAVLRIQPTLSFLTDHSEYFTEHNTVGLPNASISSIGLLNGATIVQNLTLALFTIERIIEESEEALYEVTNQFHINTIKPRNEALRRGVTLHSIESFDTVMPKEIRDWFRSNQNLVSTAHDARDEGLVHEKVSPKLHYFMHMSEKEAFITLPTKDGGYDYVGFSSREPPFLLWCRQLFNSTWETGISKGVKIKEIYAKVMTDEGLAQSITDFSGESHRLKDVGLTVGSDLTVMAEVIKLYLSRGVPLGMVDPGSYWKQMR